MNFRIEDDHSLNVSMLQAMADDSHFIEEVETFLKERT